MGNWLNVILVVLVMYTVLTPGLTGEIKHFRYGLLLLLALGIFAYINYLFGVL